MALSNHSLMLVSITISYLLLTFTVCATDSGQSPSESDQTATRSTRCTINCFRADPVCGVNGVTYTCGNPEAQCNNVAVAYRGACRNSGCTIECFRADPVCGVNGVTYTCGDAEAQCNNVAVAYRGACHD